MKRHRLAVLLGILSLCMVFSACTSSQEASTLTPQPKTATPIPQPDIEFQPDGTASLSIPSLNGSQIAIWIIKPEGTGPFPVLIGIAGGDGQHLFGTELGPEIQEMDIVAVDFAPQGRGASEGQDDHHGPIHQDDLKAVVDFVSSLSFVQQDNIGILSHSYGLALATGALSRHPEMPIAFLIDVEGPACPGRDIVRGLENKEPWVEKMILLFSGKDELSPEEYAEFEIHGGVISDEAYWSERDAARFAEDLPCPYLRVQFETDHVQGTSKHHMMEIINAATEHSGQWTRCNDNPANVVYSEDELANYHFHEYSIESIPDPENPWRTRAPLYVETIRLHRIARDCTCIISQCALLTIEILADCRPAYRSPVPGTAPRSSQHFGGCSHARSRLDQNHHRACLPAPGFGAIMLRPWNASSLKNWWPRPWTRCLKNSETACTTSKLSSKTGRTERRCNKPE